MHTMIIRHRRSAKSLMLALLMPGLAGLAVLGAGAAHEPPAASPPRSGSVHIADTPEVAFGSPQVYVLLRKDKQVLMGAPGGKLLDDAATGTQVNSFRACLDTGACSHVVSNTTAVRFGMQIRQDTAFRMYGLNGPLTLVASDPYDLALAGATGRARADSPNRFQLMHHNATLSVATNDPALSISQFSDLNLVGMPAIRQRIVELDPAPMLYRAALLGAGPAVRVGEEDEDLPRDIDLRIPLEYVDYSEQYQPDIPAPLPSLGSQPVLNDVVSERLQSMCTTRWLFDTGAATSVISFHHAKTLGLYFEDGRPVRPPDFVLRLGGAEGRVRPADGFILDRLTIPALDGRKLVFEKVHVVVRDIGATEVNGRIIVLDGIFGMNLLLPGMSGMSSLGEEGQEQSTRPGITVHRGAFEKIWIDGPHGVLGLRLRK